MSLMQRYPVAKHGSTHLRSHRRTAVIGLLGPLRCMSKGGLRGPIRQADSATISGGVNRQRQRCSNIESASQELSIKYQVIESVGKRLHDKFNQQEPPQLGLTETANKRQRTSTSGYKALWRAESCILNSCRFGCLIDLLGAGGCIRRGRREGYEEVSSRSDKLNVGEGGKEEKDSINEECSESCLVLGLQPTSTRHPETSTAPSRRWLRNGHNCQIVELEEFGAPLILCGSLVARQAPVQRGDSQLLELRPGGWWRMVHLLRSVVNPALEFKKLNLASEQPYRAWREHTAIEDYQRQRVRT
ncbi:hypothetical protein DFH06DRAFT_1132407 [Mycena polygramma]|nr:hypothetical protein DFH06DRAFT_1132407 [Mycena polygramma]